MFDTSLGGMFMIGLSKDKWRALEGALAVAIELKYACHKPGEKNV